MDPVDSPPFSLPPEPSLRGADAISSITPRQSVRVGGIVTAAGPQPWAGGEVFECRIDDQTGSVTLGFLGSRDVPAIRPGVHLWADGTVGTHRGRTILLNPHVEMWAARD